MRSDRVARFRVGVTREVRTPDGAFVFAPYDLKALEDAGIEWAFLTEEARPLRPDQLHGLNGLYHYSAPSRGPVWRASTDSRSSHATVLGSTSST
jgi:hypothetical protein